jgi:DNA polymerase elongation subunit (family B)
MQFIGFDIETDTSGIMSNGEPMGLDPRETKITSAALRGNDFLVVFDDPCEGRLLRSVNTFLMDTATEPSIIATWNGSNFDMPFFYYRSRLLGVETDLRMKETTDLRPAKYRVCPGFNGGLFAQWGPHDHVDISYVYKDLAEANGVKHSLKPVAIAYGLHPIEVNTERMQILSVAERAAYNASDSEITHTLAGLAGRAGLITPWLDSVELAKAA